MFLLAMALFWFPLPYISVYEYVSHFKLRFLTIYLIVSAVTYWFEYFRHQYHQDLVDKNDILREEKERLKQEIDRRCLLEDELKQLANTDSLTGLLNRRFFWDVSNKELHRHRRYCHDMALLLLDIDQFKNINDRFGHPTGDRVIKSLAKHCIDNIRDTDMLARIGGEEFAILLVETDSKQAIMIAERLRILLSEKKIETDCEDLFFTVSIGIATYNAGDASIDHLFQRADKALYSAKEGGRNRVEFV